MTKGMRHTCRDCGTKTGPAAFETVDDVFNPSRPLCPPCQEASMLSRSTCEFCAEQPVAMMEIGPLCATHYEHYINGYRKRD